ncbi:ribonuclease P/MRP protein subunit POP1, partial [Ostertagia ostertagi]
MPKTSIFKTRVGTELLMGKIVKLSNIGIDHVPCAQVRCSMNEFNIYLKKYFARAFEFWALDRESKGQLGDTVLIRRVGVDQRPTTNVAHAIDRNIIDPVTGRRVIKDEFADEIELRKQLVGEIIDAPLEQQFLPVEMEAEDLSKARFVKVYDYLEERAAQVADLLQVVDNSNLVSGEVTKGPRTAAQRLPRHMRRRAMAYEVRRFPKGLRNYAAPFLTNTKHRKKPPSRYFRRRSRNLLLNYIRRQRKLVWLETHIWHAKRFHVIDRWGYRLPDRSFQRNFRPCYRDSVRHCTVRDKSYLSCIVISHNNQSELISMLSPLCANSASPTFAFKSGLDGRYEVSTLIYYPGQYPRGLIGPARFLWSRE